jgi:hypothetical protein
LAAVRTRTDRVGCTCKRQTNRPSSTTSECQPWVSPSRLNRPSQDRVTVTICFGPVSTHSPYTTSRHIEIFLLESGIMHNGSLHCDIRGASVFAVVSSNSSAGSAASGLGGR